MIFMRMTIVPAQITTVEDRIAGRLGLSQLLLIVAPIFGGSAIFVVLPPFLNYAVYKVVVIVCIAMLCGLLAIRIKGKILLAWCVVILRYDLRPRYYVFNKNDLHTRVIDLPIIEKNKTEEQAPIKRERSRAPQLSTAELVKVENILNDPDTNLRFEMNKKGELSVHFAEIQQENFGSPAN
jgi:hypothetical protein